MGLLRYLALLLLLCLILQAFAIAGVYLLGKGLKADQFLDTGSFAANTLYDVPGFRTAVYGRAPLMRQGAQVILLGASNMVKGFRSVQTSAALGGEPVQNLAIDGSSFKTEAQAADLVFDVVPRTQDGNLTFVVGVWYGSFMRHDDMDLTALQREMTHFGLYRGEARPAPTIPAGLMRPALVALAPLPFLARQIDNFTWVNGLWIDAFFSGTTNGGVDLFAQNAQKIDQAARTAAIRERQAAGPISDRTIDEFHVLVRGMVAHGSRVVILDLPLPAWHSSAVPAFENYQKQKMAIFAPVTALPGVQYFNMQDGFSDDDFYDSVHPKPLATARWSARLAGYLRQNAN
jgi:hypothetical protein